MSTSLPPQRRLGLRKDGKPLLRIVGNAQHAGREHHYEDTEEDDSSSSARNEQASSNAVTESQSSNAELSLPPPPRARSTKPIVLPSPPGIAEDKDLNPPPKSKRKAIKRYAPDYDHDEPTAKRRASPDSWKAQPCSDVDAEPMSSSDELARPPPSVEKSSKARIAVERALASKEDELKAPPTGSMKTRTRIQSEAKAKLDKGSRARTRANDDKENSLAGAVQSSSNTAAGDDPFGFSMEHMSQKNNKRRGAGPKMFGNKGKTPNIHAQPPSKKGARRQIIVPRAHATNKRSMADKSSQDENSESDCSMVGRTLEDDEFDEIMGPDDKELVLPKRAQKQKAKNTSSQETAEPVKATSPKSSLPHSRATPGEPDLRKPRARAPKSKPQANDQELHHPMLSDKELEEQIKEHDRLNPKPTKLQNQLDNWKAAQAPDSSLPRSSAPDEALDHIDDYLVQHPEEEEEGTRCPICKETVDQAEYQEYWRGKKNTVRHQNAFCRAHRIKAAWHEYRSEGYPDIDWKTLPDRIGKYRMKLYGILNNKLPSAYRDRYAPIALTGKAAAVPSRRKDLPEHVQEELESYALDDQSTYPGYYGPHGRRVITENVMRILKNEIKACTDAVVQGSGPATFVQAVLVPETAILLIMEDRLVDREEAEEIREKTYDMGMLLNEEIEDHVEVYGHSDKEDEYFGR